MLEIKAPNIKKRKYYNREIMRKNRKKVLILRKSPLKNKMDRSKLALT